MKRETPQLEGKCQRQPQRHRQWPVAHPHQSIPEHVTYEKQSHPQIHVPSSNSKEGRSTETTNDRNAVKIKCSVSAPRLKQGPGASTPQAVSHLTRGFIACADPSSHFPGPTSALLFAVWPPSGICLRGDWFRGGRVGHVLGYTTCRAVTQLRLCLRYMLQYKHAGFYKKKSAS